MKLIQNRLHLAAILWPRSSANQTLDEMFQAHTITKRRLQAIGWAQDMTTPLTSIVKDDMQCLIGDK